MAGVVVSISEALVTTQGWAWAVALPGLFPVMLIHRQRQNLDATITRLESLTLAAALRQRSADGRGHLERAA
ncbi:MAG: hypothetical protein R3F21_09050 [Myxococcota bacterium]